MQLKNKHTLEELLYSHFWGRQEPGSGPSSLGSRGGRTMPSAPSSAPHTGSPDPDSTGTGITASTSWGQSHETSAP